MPASCGKTHHPFPQKMMGFSLPRDSRVGRDELWMKASVLASKILNSLKCF
jgi:hypothetical protein